MPNIYVHYFTGMDAMLKMPTRLVKQIHPQAYRFGLHGPDFFFYYNLAPIRPNVRVPSLGSAVHRRNVGEFFAACLEFAQNERGTRRDMATSYLAGFLGHYATDCTLHPYVYYFSKVNRYHTLLETLMDAQILEYRGESRQSLPSGYVASAGAGKWCIADMYRYALKRAHDINVPRSVLIKSMDSFARFMRKLDDPGGKSYRRNKRFERVFLGSYPLMTRALHPPKLDETDYLNLKHREWHKPWNYEYVSTASVPDMMEEASTLTADYVLALYKAMEDSTMTQIALDFFGQNCFLTGENWRLENKGMHYECLFE